MARFIEEFIAAPRIAEVYNIGGGRANCCSIWEAFKIAEKFSGKAQVYQYVDENRIGDHICYISELTKMRRHYPAWDITVSLEETIRQIVAATQEKLKAEIRSGAIAHFGSHFTAFSSQLCLSTFLLSVSH